MASIWTQAAIVDGLTASINLSTDTLKIMLLKSTYTPDQDHQFVSSLSANECDATGYTGGFAGAGRKTLASKTVAVDNTNNRAKFDAADPSTWTSLGGASNNTLRYAAIIKEITNDAASKVICILDFGSNGTTNGGNVDVAFHADGIGYIAC